LKKYFPIVAFAAVALASLAMAGFAYLAAEEATRIKFEATADDALNRIESRVGLHLSLLRDTDAFFTARAGQVSGSEFKTYFDALQVDKNLEGLRGLGLLGMARPGEEALLERAITERLHVEKPIYPRALDGEWRMPVLLVEPLDRIKLTGIGYDMFSDPLRREAILATIETGEPRATGRVMLGQQAGGEVTPGFLLFSTLERPGATDSRPLGTVFAAFRTQELLKAVLDKFPQLPVHAEVFDGANDTANLLFRSAAAAADTDLATTRQLLVAGRPWTIEFRPTAEFTRPSSPAIPVLLGMFGLMLAAAIALLQRYQARAYEAASTLQENAEKSLLEKDLMLQEMKHRIKNSITRVLAIARQTAAGAKDIGEFQDSFSARLQAMAASQDMLTRSRWQKADLGELLRIELAQAFGKELPEGMLNGPKVLLSETMTQALGLTFHELATNALKYGEVGNSSDALKVEWQVRNQGSVLSLSWRETSSTAVTPPEKPGFGTRLIDMNITRELKGTIRRDYRADGLHIEIEIPLSAVPLDGGKAG
jgi:CHASE1-domain containing sensor protein/two-component sensor histidine kinase